MSNPSKAQIFREPDGSLALICMDCVLTVARGNAGESDLGDKFAQRACLNSRRLKGQQRDGIWTEDQVVVRRDK